METPPLISALLRNKTGPILVALQVAITLAVAVNALYLIALRIEVARRATGMDVQNIFWVQSRVYAQDFNHQAAAQADLQYLSSLPGVRAATTINFPPMSGQATVLLYYTMPGQKGLSQPANVYLTNEHGLTALGVRLLAGSMFDASTVAPAVNAIGARGQAVISQALAGKLFPDGDALGKTIYGSADQPVRIIGVIERMLGGYPMSAAYDSVALFPGLIVDPSGGQVRYLVRTLAGRRNEVMARVEATLEQREQGRIITKVETLQKTASQALTDVRGTSMLLMVVVTLVLAVAALGIFGLATFNVLTRTRQIGTRRALGARKADIVRYFIVENWVVTSGGIVLGCILALFIAVKLSSLLQMPRLPFIYVLCGVMSVWALGLLAALIPARRAAAVPPAMATRSV
jgi:putative ABC transport system permease protein